LVAAPGQSPPAVDARNIWRPHEVQRAGLHYVGIGVPSQRGADRPSQRW